MTSLVYDRHHQYQMTGTSNAVGVVNVSLQQPRRPNLIQGDWQPPTQGFQLGTGAVEMPRPEVAHLETETVSFTECEVRRPEAKTNVRFPQKAYWKQKIELHHKNIIIAQIFVLVIFTILLAILLAHLSYCDCSPELCPSNNATYEKVECFETTQAPLDQQSCVDDGYSVLKYSPPQGRERQIKYKVFLSLSNKKSSFNNMKQNCQDQKAVLWEILDDQVEWDAMKAELNSTFQSSDIWLNGFILNNCTSSNCNKDQAKQGNGLLVRWSTSGELSNYSRASVAASGESTCSFIQNGPELLWIAGVCDDEKVAICVKRNCKS